MSAVKIMYNADDKTSVTLFNVIGNNFCCIILNDENFNSKR